MFEIMLTSGPNEGRFGIESGRFEYSSILLVYSRDRATASVLRVTMEISMTKRPSSKPGVKDRGKKIAKMLNATKTARKDQTTVRP